MIDPQKPEVIETPDKLTNAEALALKLRGFARLNPTNHFFKQAADELEWFEIALGDAREELSKVEMECDQLKEQLSAVEKERDELRRDSMEQIGQRNLLVQQLESATQDRDQLLSDARVMVEALESCEVLDGVRIFDIRLINKTKATPTALRILNENKEGK